MQNNKLIIAKEWFKKAEDDYKSAKVVLEEGGYYGTTCFLSQQIAEKYLKGYLIFAGQKFEKIHDLVRLLHECKKLNQNFSELDQICIVLNNYYIETRYPLDPPIDYSKKTAKIALEYALEVKKIILKNI